MVDWEVIQLRKLWLFPVSWAMFFSAVNQTSDTGIPVFTADSLTEFDSAYLDIDGDGIAEYCTLRLGPTSGVFSFVLTAESANGIRYENLFVLPHGSLSFTESCGKAGLCRKTYAEQYRGITIGEDAVFYYDIAVDNGILTLHETAKL